jgi:tetratricopeptide (TPR) repeat protein
MGIPDWLRAKKSDHQQSGSPEHVRRLYEHDHQFFYDQGIALYEVGRHEEAIDSFRTAIRLNPGFAWAFCNLAVVLDELGRHREALDAIDKALSIDPQDPDFRRNREQIAANLRGITPSAPSDTSALTRQATEHFQRGRFTEAIACIDKALEVDERAFGPESREVAYHLKNRGMALISLGRYSEALKDCARALGIFERLDGRVSNQVAVCLNDIGCAYLASGVTQRALPCLKEAVAIDRQIHQHPHPDLGRHLANLANALLTASEAAAGKKTLKEAYEILVQALGPVHPDCIQVRQVMNSLK